MNFWQGAGSYLPAVFDSRVWPLTTSLLRESQTVSDSWSSSSNRLAHLFTGGHFKLGQSEKTSLKNLGSQVCLKGWVGRRRRGRRKDRRGLVSGPVSGDRQGRSTLSWSYISVRGCPNTAHTTQKPRTAAIYSLTIGSPEVQKPGVSRATLPLKALGKDPTLAFFIILIGEWLLHHVVLVSGLQPSASVIHTHISSLF